MRDRFTQFSKNVTTLVSKHPLGETETELRGYYRDRDQARYNLVQGQESAVAKGFLLPTTYGAYTGYVRSERFHYEALNMPGSFPYGRVFGNSAPNSERDGVWQALDDTGIDTPVAPRAKHTRAQSITVRAECLAKVSDSDFNLGLALAEARQTGDLVAQSTITVLSVYKAVRKRQYKKALALLGIRGKRKRELLNSLSGTASSAWLQLSFGWLPLIADIYGAIETLTKSWNFKSPILSATRTRTFDNTGLVTLGSGQWLAEGKLETKLTVKLFYTIEDRLLYVMNSLGLLNPLTIVWEKVPYSFVIDWFVPVGTFLSNLTGLVGCQYVSGYESIHTKTTEDLRIGYRVANLYKVSGGYPHFRVSAKAWSREVLPFPADFKGLPAFRLGLNRRRSIHAMALINQLRLNRRAVR